MSPVLGNSIWFHFACLQVQYTSVSHCSLNFECPRLVYGFMSIILVLEKNAIWVFEKSLNFVLWVCYEPWLLLLLHSFNVLLSRTTQLSQFPVAGRFNCIGRRCWLVVYSDRYSTIGVLRRTSSLTDIRRPVVKKKSMSVADEAATMHSVAPVYAVVSKSSTRKSAASAAKSAVAGDRSLLYSKVDKSKKPLAESVGWIDKYLDTLLASQVLCLQCSDAVGWAAGRASGLYKLSDEVLVWLSVWSEVQIVCIRSSWCHCIPKPHHLLHHLNQDWFYLSDILIPAYAGCPGK